MNAQELLTEWEAGDSNGLRAARVQELREDLQTATGEPIPRNRGQIEALILDHPQKVGVITRKLREAAAEEAGDG